MVFYQVSVYPARDSEVVSSIGTVWILVQVLGDDLFKRLELAALHLEGLVYRHVWKTSLKVDFKH